MMKKLDLSRDAMGISALETINEKAFEKLISKCEKYISRIIYRDDYYILQSCARYKLIGYISTHFFNITSLNLTALTISPEDVNILAEHCKKLKILSLTLYLQCAYEEQLTKLFEVNKNLENIALYNMEYVCHSLMKLPEHKMKAITIDCFYDIEDNILSSVSMLQFFLYLILIIGMFHPCRS